MKPKATEIRVGWGGTGGGWIQKTPTFDKEAGVHFP